MPSPLLRLCIHPFIWLCGPSVRCSWAAVQLRRDLWRRKRAERHWRGKVPNQEASPPSTVGAADRRCAAGEGTSMMHCDSIRSDGSEAS